jgi:DNA-binding MarR family transcriptional regulator
LIEAEDNENEDETPKKRRETKPNSKKKSSRKKPRVRDEETPNRPISMNPDRIAKILKEFHEMKLNLRDLQVLLHLFEETETHYFSTIKTFMNLENQQIARVLDKLLKNKLINRISDGNTKISENRVHYSLTDLGKEIIVKISAL